MSSPTGPRVGLRVTFLGLTSFIREVVRVRVRDAAAGAHAGQVAYSRITNISRKNVMRSPTRTRDPVGEDMLKLIIVYQCARARAHPTEFFHVPQMAVANSSVIDGRIPYCTIVWEI
jgi:hypothetical protein